MKTKRIFATDDSGRDIFNYVESEAICHFTCIFTLWLPQWSKFEMWKWFSCTYLQLFDLLTKNSQNVYTFGPSTFIDEILFPFRGRCRFKMYMPNKPVKYGLKIISLTDSRNHYLYNSYLYTGKDSYGKSLTAKKYNRVKPTQSVIRLTKANQKNNRNVTADNRFSSVELVEELCSRGLTCHHWKKINDIPANFFA